MWRGEMYDVGFFKPSQIPDSFAKYAEVAARIHRGRTVAPGDREILLDIIVNVTNPRLRATRAQFVSEFFLFVGDDDAAMESIEVAVTNNLQDHLWMQKCPLLDRVRERPRFKELAAI